MDYKGNKANHIPSAVETGSEITGAVAGTALGLVLAGPLGAVVSSAIGPAISKTLKELWTRLLSQREQERVEQVAEVALEQVRINQESGKHLRMDGFFDPSDLDRSAADEIVEGVLMKAQREHQERKLRYLGRMLGNIGFENGCSVEQANYLINTFERLSYQQLVIIRMLNGLDLNDLNIWKHYDNDDRDKIVELKYILEREQDELRDQLMDVMNNRAFDADRLAACAEVFELFSLGLLEYSAKGGTTKIPPPVVATAIRLPETYSSLLGRQLYRLCQLKDIPMADVERLKITLSGTAPIRLQPVEPV